VHLLILFKNEICSLNKMIISLW